MRDVIRVEICSSRHVFAPLLRIWHRHGNHFPGRCLTRDASRSARWRGVDVAGAWDKERKRIYLVCSQERSVISHRCCYEMIQFEQGA